MQQKILSFSFLLLFISALVNAQTLPVDILVTKGGNIPVKGAEIKLDGPSGTTPIPKFFTDSNGHAIVTLEMRSAYLIDITAKGFRNYSDRLVADTGRTSFTFTMIQGQAMKEATITATKPLMRQEDDKTIIDPEVLAASATSAYEVIEKTPGIIADPDGNFYMTSSTPASIYINGKEMKMSNTDVAAMLKSLPPNALAKIEIMRTPSAKYDASGSGGILNIVLKKGVKIGLTGSVNGGIQQGVYGNQFGGLSLNYSDGDKSAYMNLNIAHRKSLEKNEALRHLSNDSTLNQDAGTVYNSKNIFLGYGASKNIDSTWEFSYDGRISTNFNHNTTESKSLINLVSTGDLQSNNLSGTINDGHNINVDQSVDVKYKFDTSGSEWSTSLSWNGNFGNNEQDINFRSIVPVSNEIINDGDIKTSRNYFAFQTDLKYKYKYHLTFETGLKSTATFFRHNSDYTYTYNGTSAPDATRSATYRYNENINAAYIQVSKQIKDIVIKPGVRVENTNMVGEQTRPGTSNFTLRRTDFFPYVYLSKKVMTIAHYDLRAFLVYRRTILRPSYDYLNPFQRFVDPYLYETGNPTLRPQFTTNYEANVSIDERPLIAVGVNEVTDIFSNVVYQSDTNKSIAYRTYDNLGKNRETYIRGFGAIPPGGKYFFVLGGQYNYVNYDGVYNEKPLLYKRESWTIFTYHTLKIGKNTNLQANGYMRLNGLMQFYELGTFGQLNASISHNFMDKKLQVTLSAQDIFYTNKFNYSIDQGGLNATGSRYNDSQRYGINVRYNFGIRKKEEHDDILNMGNGEKKGDD